MIEPRLVRSLALGCLAPVALAACGGPDAPPVAPATPIASAAPAAPTAIASSAPPADSTPPAAPTRPVVDSYFGVSITDPYRWMETPGSSELQTFLHAENDYARARLDHLRGRDALLARIHQLGEAGDSVSEARRAGRWVFAERRPASANGSRLVVRDGVAGTERVLVDPAAKDTAETHYALDWFFPSDDGALVAYGLSAGGSEDSVLHVVETATGRDLGEAIDRMQFGGVAWLPDGKSFFYTREQPRLPGAAPTDRYLRAHTYLHRLGANADSEAPLLGAGVPGPIALADSDTPFIVTDPSSRWAYAIISRGSRPEFALYVAPLAAAKTASAKWTRIAEVEDGVGDFAVHGDDVFLLSHHGAPRSKVLKVRAQAPDIAHAGVVVAEGNVVLTQVATASDGLYVGELDAGLGRIVRVAFESRLAAGPVTPVTLPFDGALRGMAANTKLPGVLVREEGWLRSPTWLLVGGKAGATATDTGLVAPAAIDTSPYAALEVRVPSTDGAMVPLSIVARKDVVHDGSHPTLLTGYGAYGLSLSPSFVRTKTAWLEHGGILAIAHVRGGGELGEEWHQAGRATTKQHTVDDFLACARWLVSERYTDAAHLAGIGGSAGGITVGNAVVQAPDLFAAMLISVGDTNTLRTEFGTDGASNAAEYGSVQTEEGFRGLYAVDAFHHVKDGVHYPAVLLTTGANDPRVAVWQPAKMTARLQAANGGERPVLLRVDFDAGHGIGSSRAQEEKLLADELAFLLWQMGDKQFARE